MNKITLPTRKHITSIYSIGKVLSCKEKAYYIVHVLGGDYFLKILFI